MSVDCKHVDSLGVDIPELSGEGQNITRLKLVEDLSGQDHAIRHGDHIVCEADTEAYLLRLDNSAAWHSSARNPNMLAALHMAPI